jgi:hypothetical protein
MKKAGLLLLCGALVFAACQKDPVPSKDATLDGVTVDVSGITTSAQKLFVLNEGGMGSNNSTLDFLRFEDGKYITSAFKKMNPNVGAGLGDVGNDIAVNGDEVWMVINNSGIVEVVSAKDEIEIATVTVPTPRNIAFDNKYAYVTSWAGAYANYGADYSITDYSNPKGQVYRINLSTKKVDGTVEVGYQPEGIAVYNGKLYVANSGGIASQLPPTYSYDNTVSIIDAASFKVEKTIEVQVNLKNVYSDGKGNIYVTTLGNYWDVHSGLYMVPVSAPEQVKVISDYVSVSALNGDTVYCIGTDSEFDWSGTPHVYSAWSVTGGVKKALSLNIQEATPYGLAVLNADTFIVADAGDYFNPGSVACYYKGSRRWSVTAGVCPGHVVLY